MVIKVQKFHVMPLVIGLTPTGLALPGTVPLVQREQAVGGMLRWPVVNWNNEEFERIGEAINSLTRMSRGKSLEDYVVAVAETVAKIIPNREFHLEISNFGIDYKLEDSKRRG